VKCFAKTHPGNVRDHNEDAIGWDDKLALAVLADGMGGHASGEVASDICRTTIMQRVGEGEALTAAVLQAHAEVLRAAAQDQARNGMGSTVVVARANQGNYEIAWVGDSRAYLWRDGTLTQLTRDHSYLEWLITTGQLNEQDARNHPQKNIVTQSIGLGDPKPDLVRGRLHSGDRILLCSDGLTDELTDTEIAALCRQYADSGELVDALVNQALIHGGRDNVSVMVSEFENLQVEIEPDATMEFEIPRNPWRAVVVGVVAAALMSLLVMAYFLNL